MLPVRGMLAQIQWDASTGSFVDSTNPTVSSAKASLTLVALGNGRLHRFQVPQPTAI